MDFVTQRSYGFNGQPVYLYSTDYDSLGRPTNAIDSLSSAREWLHNHRSELIGATSGTNVYDYTYDTIGNRSWAAANIATNSYTANALNQYTMIGWIMNYYGLLIGDTVCSLGQRMFCASFCTENNDNVRDLSINSPQFIVHYRDR